MSAVESASVFSSVSELPASASVSRFLMATALRSALPTAWVLPTEQVSVAEAEEASA